MADRQSVTGIERYFSPHDIIVSKTNTKGHITYANKTFIDISGFDEREIINAPHRILRHPDMPRCIFKLMWDTIEAKKEIFAYVVNRTKNGDHYWVLAHVTPSLIDQGEIDGYHSNRRVPDVKILDEIIKPLYKTLITEEEKYPNRKEGMMAGYHLLLSILKDKGMHYDEFIFSL
jgi:PAS domain S-box-containing protein